nr:hypothetical protein [uncultured Allomuricauda sp.]
MKTKFRSNGFIVLLIFGLFHYKCIGQTTEIAFFQANNEGSKGNIFLMNPDGSEPKQIGQSGIRPDYYPNWSKDGQKITFLSYRRGGWRIWITDPDGSNARRLDNVGRDYEFDPVFDADGSHVVYSRQGDLYQVNVQSGKTELLVKTDNKYESQPDVSIHNEVLYVSGDESGSNIIKKNLKNGKKTTLTDTKHADLAPVWSPDAEEVLFYSDREGGFELFIMNSDGSDVRRVVSNETLKNNGIRRGAFFRLDEGWNHDLQYRASFSPDGQWIAFSANTSLSREIFIISKDGKSLQQVTKNKLHDGLPSFRPILKN